MTYTIRPLCSKCNKEMCECTINQIRAEGIEKFLNVQLATTEHYNLVLSTNDACIDPDLGVE